MALTDASFLLFWVVGLISAQRFLERPGLARAIILGLSVGIAQLFKYNGWLIGSIVILTAIAGLALDPQERTRLRFLTLWGSGLLAALVAAVVYWPWFRFVESHGGYGKLLAHHQSYMSSSNTWLPHLGLQLDQAASMSGGSVWEAAAFLTACSCYFLAFPPRTAGQRWSARILIVAPALLIVPHLYFLVAALWMPLFRRFTVGQRVLGLSWLVLLILTPFYHPYVRLWLPLQHLGWVILPGCTKAGLTIEDGSPYASVPGSYGRTRTSLLLAVLLGLCCIRVIYPTGQSQFPWLFGSGNLPRPLSASDSLRTAVSDVLRDLPRDIPGLRLLARPPVTFYLGGRVPVKVEPNSDGLLQSGHPNFWALVDGAQLAQEGDATSALNKLFLRWSPVRKRPTKLNLPTILDVDPGAARRGSTSAAAAEATLWLLRPPSRGPSQ
jgi:hypothetical protein